MQIVCPNCTTSYQIADAAIGANGRSVRCVRCQTVWHATPLDTAAGDGFSADAVVEDTMAKATEADETVAAFRAALDEDSPEPAPPTEPLDDPVDSNASEGLAGTTESEPVAPIAAGAPAEAPPVALSDIPIPLDDTPSLVPALGYGQATVTQVTSLDDNGPPDIESVAARRARTAASRRGNRLRIPLPVAIVALATLCVVLTGWRKDIVRHAPQLASFYSAIGLPVNLRGLTFTDMKIGNEIHDGVPVLVVEGMIVSTVSKPVDVPRLRFALRSATGADVYAWTAQPSQQVLGAFEAMPFRSRLASPPAEGHDIQVRFFTRRDAVAGLR
jgi:predicted Zn finger-like uncharacterized protein